jgi:hypothetical protein
VTGEIVVANYGGHYVSRISPAGRANRFVGDGIAGADADGITVAARVYAPIGVIVDTNGVTYVATYEGYHVKQVSTGGSVTGFVGSGVMGYNEGVGAAAQFRRAFSLAMLGTATVFVTDAAKYILRKVVVSTATTSLVAGTPATPGFVDGPVARFDIPSVLSVSSTGIAYLCEYGNHAIRKVALDSTVATIAGTGAAGSVDSVYGVHATFNQPYGNFLLGDAFLMVTELLGNVRLVDVSTGLVSTYIAAPCSGPADVTANTAGTTVHVACRYDHQVRVFAPTASPTYSPSASTTVTPSPVPTSSVSAPTTATPSPVPTLSLTPSASRAGTSTPTVTTSATSSMRPSAASQTLSISPPPPSTQSATASPTLSISPSPPSTQSATASTSPTPRAVPSPSATLSQQASTVSASVSQSRSMSSTSAALSANASSQELIVGREKDQFADAVSQAVAVAAVVAVSPAVAGMVARTTAITDTLLCRATIDRVPDFAVSPTRAEIEMTGNDAPVRYHIGGFIGNAALVLATALYNYCFDTALCALHRSEDDSWRAIITPHVPSVFVVPVVFFAQPFVSSAVTVLGFALGSIGGMVCAVAVFVMCLAASIACAVRLLRGEFPAEFRPVKDSVAGSARNGGATAAGYRVGVLLFGTEGEWTDLPLDGTGGTSLEQLLGAIDRRMPGNDAVSIGFVASYDKIFTDYNRRARWFLLVEFTACQYLGVITGLLPFVSCALLQILALVGVALFALCMLVVRPYATLFDNALLIAATLCQLVAAVLAVFSAADAAQTMLAVGGFIVLVQLAGTFAVWAVRLIYRKRQTKLRDEKSATSSDGSESSDDSERGYDLDASTSTSINSDLFLLDAVAEAPQEADDGEEDADEEEDGAIDIAKPDDVAVDADSSPYDQQAHGSPAEHLPADTGSELPATGARVLGEDAIDILQLGDGVVPTSKRGPTGHVCTSQVPDVHTSQCQINAA